MDLNQNLSDFFPSNTTGQAPKADSGPTTGLNTNLGDFFPAPAPQRPAARPAQASPESVAEFVKSVEPHARRVAERLGVPVAAVVGQWGLETGWGRSVIPGTNNLGNIKDTSGAGVDATDNQTGSRDRYRQYDTPDEFATDFASLLGGTRYRGAQGAKDAQSYFSGLKAGGYAEDPAYVEKGTAAAKMAEGHLSKQPAGPDLSKAPKWADVQAKPEFQALSPQEKQAAKEAYFDHWIAPQAGGEAQALRQKFLAATPGAAQGDTGPSFMDRMASFFGGAADGQRGPGVVAGKESVLQGAAPAEGLPTDSKAPVRPEVRAAFNAAWDAATPAERQAMTNAPGWQGMLARERTGQFDRYDHGATPTGQKLDPRAEARTAQLIAKGEAGPFAERAGRAGAARGVAPGQELRALDGTVQPSTYDFDTKQAFDPNQPANGLNNPLMRGLAKGGIGMVKAAEGVNQALYDVFGADEMAKQGRAMTDRLRGGEQAIGERGDFMSRNLEGAVSSIAQQLPLMIGGIRAGAEAIPLAGMAVQSFGQEYSDGRAQGQTVGQALTRASLFAAFEVLGERFGIKENMEGLKSFAKKMPAEKIAAFFGDAFLKDLPGELMTTTGQFMVDKLPDGTGLNPKATFEDYLKQMADTIAQTVLQAGMMTGSTAGVRRAGQFMRQDQSGATEYDAEFAKNQALAKWAEFAKAGRQETPDGRIEPTMAPPQHQEHQITQDVQSLVAEAAQAVGLPADTVLPKAPEPAQPAQAEAAPGQFSDQDVLNFANARYQDLREKRDGGIQSVDGDNGAMDEDLPAQGLTPAEAKEMQTLEQARGDVPALRQAYGFVSKPEQAAPTPADPFAPLADHELDAGAMPGASDPLATSYLSAWTDKELADAFAHSQDPRLAAELQARAQPQQEIAQDVPQPSQPGTQASQEAGPQGPAQGQDQGLIPLEAVHAAQPAAPTKPKNEREARTAKALDRIARGTAYFAKESKAREFIKANGLGDTHTLQRHPSGANRWDVVAKDAPTNISPTEQQNGPQADQAQQAEAQRPQEEPAAGQSAVTAPGGALASVSLQDELGNGVGSYADKLKARIDDARIKLEQAQSLSPTQRKLAGHDVGAMTAELARLESKREEAQSLDKSAQRESISHGMLKSARQELDASALTHEQRIDVVQKAAATGNAADAALSIFDAVDANSIDAELQDALGHLGDVLSDVFQPKANAVPTKHSAADLLPALSKVIELLVRKGFKSFSDATTQAARAMRGNEKTAPFVDQISARQWKAAYNAIAEGHEGTDSEDAVHGTSAESVFKMTGAKAKEQAKAPAPTPKPTGPDLHTPEGKFKVAQELAHFFEGGGEFKSIVEARKKISEITGQGINPGTETAKQADEAIETAVVLAGRAIVEAGRKQGRTPQVIYDRLVDLYNRQPNLAVRSSTSVRDQAYSTPVPLAYLASELAGITHESKVLEPTAGNGMLLIGADMAKATANELNTKRAAMLDAMGFKAETKNAATATLAALHSQDAVIANPPFGITKNDKGDTIIYQVSPNYSTREVDHAIAFKALATMKDDGRAVLIVGGSNATSEEGRREDYRGKSKREFYFNLYQAYNVTDHFTVDGALYARQGASYPVDVIVINGRGKSARDLPAADLPAIIPSYEALKEKLNAQQTRAVEPARDVSTDRVAGGDDSARAGDEGSVAGRPGRSGNADGAGRPATGSGSGGRGSDAGQTNAGKPASSGRVSGDDKPQPADASELLSDRGIPVPGASKRDAGSTGSDRADGPVALGGHSLVNGERVESGLTDRRGQEQETAHQVEYTPHSGASSVGTLVPVAMRDSIDAAIQNIEDQVGNIDEYVAQSLEMDPETIRTNFSAEQVDALALAIRNAEAGKGFIIGDQTGIGKGRVVAAMIRYALVNGKTPIFVTEKPNLYADMIRDLDDIGMTEDLALDTAKPRILITNGDDSIPYTLLRMENGEVVEHNLMLKPAKRGPALNKLMQQMMQSEDLGEYRVIFTTYSQLQTQGGKITDRMRFVQQFGAKNYMIFDESHNAGGGGETQARTKEQRQAAKNGESLVTGRAAFARTLVNNAFGTFFSSATYAKRPDVMDLYSSTNMKLAVDKISQLGDAIKSGGVPMQQVVANMLTKDGQYIRRERTFAGVSYDTTETKVDKKTAENMASAMRAILDFSRAKDSLLKQMQKELDKTGAMAAAVGGEKTTVQGANFGTIMHNLIDQMLLALKAKSSVEYAISRLKAGEKVVMTVSNTMGSFLEEYAKDVGLNAGDPVGLTFADLYDRYLEKQRLITIKDGTGAKKKHRLTDKELGPALLDKFNAVRKMIRDSGFGQAPISPIDYIHAELAKAGYKTDEITGRELILKYDSLGGDPVLARRSADIKQRVNAVRAFNGGTADVIILNQSGSTGLSLHAASKVKDKRKRHMIIVQAEKNIDTHMQMLGRVHRTGQVVAPAYSQMMADIPAEMRPAAVLMKKMASLNANTTASRKSSVTAEGVVDFMNDYGGQVAQEFLRDNPDVMEAIGGSKVIPLDEDSADASEEDIRKLTGYLPILPIAQQEKIYADLISRYNELLAREDAMGTNKLEAKAVDLDAKTIASTPLTEQKQDQSIFAAPANMELVDVKRTVKPFTSQEVRDMVREHLAGKTSQAMASQQIADLARDFDAYSKKRMAELTEKGADPVRLSEQQMLMDSLRTRTETVLRTYQVGSSISVSDKVAGTMYGVITDITRAGRTANPAAGSDWRVTIALANGDSKSLTISFSQIGNRYQFATVGQVNWYNAEKKQGEMMSVFDIFDRGLQSRREKRWMVTGNLLAGFAKYPGQIISYTKADGTIGQGVLMSRQFDFEKEQKNQPVSVKSVDDAMTFLDVSGAVIGTPGGELKISRRGNTWTFTTASSKREGGTFYLDQDLTRALGGDFYKRGSQMLSTIYYPESVRDAIEYLMGERGETLVALTMTDKARQILSGKNDTPKFNVKDDNSGHDYSYPDHSDATRRAIDALERELGGAYETEHAVEGRHSDGVDSVRPIAEVFGTQVVGYQVRPEKAAQDPRNIRGSNGFFYLGRIFLNVDSQRPHLALLGHELAHKIAKEQKGLYNKLVDAIAQYVKVNEYEAKFAKSAVGRGSLRPGMTKQQEDESIQEEFVGEVLSDGFMDPDFWRALGSKNKELLYRVQRFVAKLIQKAMDTVGYKRKTAEYLTDYAKVMQIAGEIMAEYKLPPSVEIQAPKFARMDDAPDQRTLTERVQSNLRQFFGSQEKISTFSAYDKTLATQFHKALKDQHFGKVFSYVNAMQNEVSLTTVRPASLAPNLLPKYDNIKAAARVALFGKASQKGLSKASQAIFAGTLHGKTVLDGKVWTEEELRNNFGMDDEAVGLYQEARAAIDASLDEVAAAEAYAMAQGMVPKSLRRQVIDAPQNAEQILLADARNQVKMMAAAIRHAEEEGEAAAKIEAMRATLESYQGKVRKIEGIFTMAKNLKKAGYAPLMRFGKYTVNVTEIESSGAVVRDQDGKPLTHYFGQFETRGEAMEVRDLMRRQYTGESVRIEAGTKSELGHQLYAGLSPETIALYSDALGNSNAAVKKLYELALTERSALKRRLERKGVGGYNDDLPRVLANFLTSNGRFAAQRYYLRDLNNAIKFIPHAKGDVRDEAIKLKQFVMDGQDTGSVIQASLFAWFLGGSVASAMVNLTQPVMMTGPYLSQWGPAKATAALAKALPVALGKKQIADRELAKGLKRAQQEGIVDAQEIFHLYSVGAQGAASWLVDSVGRVPGLRKALNAGSESARARVNAFGTIWGSMFAAAEGFNRRLTFVAAWDVAKAIGHPNPYAFAVRAVNETQGIYNKANRPNWARSAMGRTVMTFKQYSIMYLELLTRMAKAGPGGKMAAGAMLAVLMLLSGEEGLPFSQNLDDLIDAAGQAMGYDTNMRRSKRRLAYQILGKTFGDLALYGVSSQLPLDFSGRLGLGNIIPATGAFKQSEDQNGRVKRVMEILGPTGSQASAMLDAYDAATDGNMAKAAEGLAPKAVRDVMAGASMLDKGYSTDTRGRKVIDVTPGDAGLKAIGFNPTRNAEQTRKTAPIYQDLAVQRNVESSIVEQWARALADGDAKAAAKQQARMEEWNRKNPDTQIKITQKQLVSKAKSLLGDRDNRLMKSAPKEMRGRVAAGLDAVQ